MRSLSLAVVSAGLGVPSSTRLLADRLAQAAGGHLREAGRPVDVHMIELRELATAIAGNLVTGFPTGELRKAVETVERADGIIAATPIFNASYSGLFKSFFDVIGEDAIAGKPVLIAATGGTARHSLALEYAMRPLFAYLRAVVMPTAVFAASEDWGSGGDGRTGGLAERIGRAGRELAEAMLGRPAAAKERDEDEVIPFEEQLAALKVE